MLIRQSLAGLFILVTAAAASAQTPIGPTRQAASVFATPPGPLRGTLADTDTLPPRSIGTYAKEGAIVGGAIGAVAGGLLAEVACGLSEDANKTCTGSFLIGGVVGAAFGALPGALIGGLFPRYPKNTRVVDPEGVADRPTEQR